MDGGPGFTRATFFDIIKSDTVPMMMAAMEDWCKLWIIPVATGERIPVSEEVHTCSITKCFKLFAN